MEIGNVTINGRTALAPMAGINCTAFRILCKNYGASLIFSQMYKVKTIIEHKKDISEFLNILNIERPIAIQLVGNTRDEWEDAIKIIEPFADIIDLNFGCPNKDILQDKAGSFLVKHPDQMQKIVKRCVDVATKPVTAKIRSGWDEEEINAKEVSLMLESVGVSAITIHPRTTKQKYSGKSNWRIIRTIKQVVKIPVIGNGDINEKEQIDKMMNMTKCDLVMIGRTAVKNPAIFSEHNQQVDKSKIIIEFINLYKKNENRNSLNEVKEHVNRFCTGKYNSLKHRVSKSKSIDEIERLFR